MTVNFYNIFHITQNAFSPTFPSTCLSPDQPGYGQVVSNGTSRRRVRRNTQPATPITTTVPRERKNSWTVVTGALDACSPAIPYGHPSGPLYSSPQMYHSSNPHSYARAHPPTTWRHSPTHSPSLTSLGQSSTVSSSSNHRERTHSRYSPYPGQSSTQHRKLSGSSGGSPPLDIPALSLHERHLGVESSSQTSEPITLPPIQSTSQPRNNFTQPPYTLPPISSLEKSQGSNSAEVLRRLKMDHEVTSEGERRDEEQRFRGRSMSASIYK